MRRQYSTGNLSALLAFLAGLLALLLAGCVSPKSTAAYYLSTTDRIYPPKPKNYPIPILTKAPAQPCRVIGRLAFTTDLGWNFVRKSMLYNARANGADAVILRDMKTRTQRNFAQVPPRVDWIPIWRVFGCGPYARPVVTYYPSYRPGYIQEWKSERITFDSQMIVYR